MRSVSRASAVADDKDFTVVFISSQNQAGGLPDFVPVEAVNGFFKLGNIFLYD